jgi:hypothetical protein
LVVVFHMLKSLVSCVANIKSITKKRGA